MKKAKLREHHAALVLEEAHLHVRYGSREGTNVALVARYWDTLRREISETEREMLRRGLRPTP